ncbi:hypothetical protein [Aeromonas dhakensis]|uniref:hypothetical protein n=1 Tax=Aeromonas dhakensis TaxID=196024 RepID=UPI00342FDCCF
MKRPSPLLFIYTGEDYTACGATDQIGVGVITTAWFLVTPAEAFQPRKIHQLAPLEAAFWPISGKRLLITS